MLISTLSGGVEKDSGETAQEASQKERLVETDFTPFTKKLSKKWLFFNRIKEIKEIGIHFDK